MTNTHDRLFKQQEVTLCLNNKDIGEWVNGKFQRNLGDYWKNYFVYDQGNTFIAKLKTYYKMAYHREYVSFMVGDLEYCGYIHNHGSFEPFLSPYSN